MIIIIATEIFERRNHQCLKRKKYALYSISAAFAAKHRHAVQTQANPTREPAPENPTAVRTLGSSTANIKNRQAC